MVTTEKGHEGGETVLGVEEGELGRKQLVEMNLRYGNEGQTEEVARSAGRRLRLEIISHGCSVRKVLQRLNRYARFKLGRREGDSGEEERPTVEEGEGKEKMFVNPRVRR